MASVWLVSERLSYAQKSLGLHLSEETLDVDVTSCKGWKERSEVSLLIHEFSFCSGVIEFPRRPADLDLNACMVPSPY